MRVTLIGINYAPELVGTAVYTTGLAEHLALCGHEVTVVTTYPYYPDWKADRPAGLPRYARETRSGVTVVRCPIWVPEQPTGARRIMHHASFAGSILPAIALRLGRRARPDLVIAIAPSLICAPIAAAYACLTGAKTWLHLQDFEVEAALSTGLLPAGGRVARLAVGFERWALRRFEVVSTICTPMIERLLAKGVATERLHELRNWADLSVVTPMAEGDSPYRDTFNITTPYVALYSGNVANKQGIEILVEAARLMAQRRDLTFVICGEGPALPGLKAAAQGLDNVQFHALQPRNALGDLMGLASVHLLPQIAGAADLLLPSKLTNMLASGRPVIATADAGTGLAQEVEGCGVVVRPGDAPALADALSIMLDDPAERARLGAAARARAVERWDAASVLDRAEARMLSLTRD